MTLGGIALSTAETVKVFSPRFKMVWNDQSEKPFTVVAATPLMVTAEMPEASDSVPAIVYSKEPDVPEEKTVSVGGVGSGGGRIDKETERVVLPRAGIPPPGLPPPVLPEANLLSPLSLLPPMVAENDTVSL